MTRNKYIFIIFAVLAISAGAYLFIGKDGKGTVSAEQIKDTKAAATRSAGVNIPAAPSSGEVWSKRCNKDDSNYCEVFQRLVVKENNQRLIEMAIGYPKDSKGAQAVVVLPLGVVMTSGIGLKVDQHEPNTAMVRSCNKEGCYVFMELPDNLVDTMKSGKQITVTFLDGQAKPINVALSLEGFGKQLETIH